MITLAPEGGSPRILTAQAARKQIDPDGEMDPVFAIALTGVGETVRVKLKDGSFATIRKTEEKPQPEFDEATQWPIEALPSPLTPHYAHVKTHIELDMNVSLMAIDKIHAEQIIKDVLRGAKPAPPEFRVIFDTATTKTFMERLSAIFHGNREIEIAAAGVADVFVTGFSPPSHRMLAYNPGAEA